MFVEIPTEPVDLEIDGTLRHFQMEQQTIRKAALFMKGLDRAVFHELSTAADDRTLEEIVESSPDCIEHLLCAILAPTDDGPPLQPGQLLDLRIDQRTKILQTQIDLNRLDQLTPKVVATVMEIQVMRLARAILETNSSTKLSGVSQLTGTTPSESATPTPEPSPSKSGESSNETSGYETSLPAGSPDAPPAKSLTSE